MVAFAQFDLEMCVAPQRRAIFWHPNFQKRSEAEVLCIFWLGNVLCATTACNFSFLIWPDGSARAALASLLFDPPDPQIIGKTMFRDFPNISRTCIFFWLFSFSESLLLFLYSLTLLISAFQLSILSGVWLLNFLWPAVLVLQIREGIVSTWYDERITLNVWYYSDILNHFDMILDTDRLTWDIHTIQSDLLKSRGRATVLTTLDIDDLPGSWRGRWTLVCWVCLSRIFGYNQSPKMIGKILCQGVFQNFCKHLRSYSCSSVLWTKKHHAMRLSCYVASCVTLRNHFLNSSQDSRHRNISSNHPMGHRSHQTWRDLQIHQPEQPKTLNQSWDGIRKWWLNEITPRNKFWALSDRRYSVENV